MEFALNRIDPVKKAAFLDDRIISPMDPPDAYAPPRVEQVATEELHPRLREFVVEHQRFLTEIDAFEQALLTIRKTGYSREADDQLKRFLNFFDEELLAHHRREEAMLFPVLRRHLIAAGEHGSGEHPETPTDLMQDEHTKSAQLAAVILNFLGLAFRFREEEVRLTILDAALEQASNLVEALRLHIFREDKLIFPLAHRLLLPAELAAL